MEETQKQVVVGYYMSPDGQIIPLMADAKYYPNGVPESPLLMPRTGQAVLSGASLSAGTPKTAAGKPQVPPSIPQVPPSIPQTYSGASTVKSVRPSPPSKTKKQNKNLENVVGRNLMGILASILIFIGMILFSTVAYEAFGTAARVFFVYAVSGVLLAIGLIGMRKNRNAFYLSLAGCGVGAVYISLFLTYGYFELINGFALYILLAIWSVIVFFLGGKASLLFKTIGQSGVLISAIYGTVMQFMEMRSPAALSFTLVLMFYYIVVTVFYLLMDHTDGYKANLPALIMDFIGAVTLAVAAVNIRGEIQLPVQIALTGIILAYTLFLLFIYRQRIMRKIMTENSSLLWVLVVFAQAVFAALTIYVLISKGGQDSKWIRGCIAMVQYAALWWLTEFKTRRDDGRIASLMVIYLFLVIYSGSFGILSEILGIGIFALLFLTMGFFKKDKLYFAFGCVSSFIYILFYGKYPGIYSLFSVLFILLILFFQLYSDRIYHLEFKLVSYAMMQIFLLRLVGILAEHTVLSRAIWINIVYLVSVLLCIVATHSPFSNDWFGNGQKEKNTQIALGTLNILLILWGCDAMGLMNGEVFHVLTLLVFLAACCQNIMPMVRHYGKSLGAGFYTGFKLTVFLQSALYSYETESYVVTLACLFMALVFITFGFLKNYKPIRLYGLLLSLYSIFKLVLVDVTYNSTLSKSLTIMGCGVMAFLISFVYNKISKKFEEVEAGTQETVAVETKTMEAAEAKPTETVETEPAEIETTKTEAVEMEAADALKTEATETEPTEMETAKIETAEKEAVEIEIAETAETETAETEIAEKEAAKTETVETETVETEKQERQI